MLNGAKAVIIVGTSYFQLLTNSIPFHCLTLFAYPLRLSGHYLKMFNRKTNSIFKWKHFDPNFAIFGHIHVFFSSPIFSVQTFFAP